MLLTFEEGPAVSLWWEALVTTNSFTSTHVPFIDPIPAIIIHPSIGLLHIKHANPKRIINFLIDISFALVIDRGVKEVEAASEAGTGELASMLLVACFIRNNLNDHSQTKINPNEWNLQEKKRLFKMIDPHYGDRISTSYAYQNMYRL